LLHKAIIAALNMCHLTSDKSVPTQGQLWTCIMISQGDQPVELYGKLSILIHVLCL